MHELTTLILGTNVNAIPDDEEGSLLSEFLLQNCLLKLPKLQKLFIAGKFEVRTAIDMIKLNCFQCLYSVGLPVERLSQSVNG